MSTPETNNSGMNLNTFVIVLVGLLIAAALMTNGKESTTPSTPNSMANAVVDAIPYYAAEEKITERVVKPAAIATTAIEEDVVEPDDEDEYEIMEPAYEEEPKPITKKRVKPTKPLPVKKTKAFKNIYREIV